MTSEKRVALVTGGSSGIGRATALAFAREGAAVAIMSRGRERGESVLAELRAIAGNEDALFVQGDVSKRQDVERLVTSIAERYGRLDVAVNGAAELTAGAFKETAAIEENEFDGHMFANLKSVWLCMKLEIEQMLKQQDGGAIINISSVNGLGGVPHNSLYATSKAGVLALTKSAALEYATRGIRINALVAGGFRTPMLESVFAQMNADDPESVAQAYGQMVPVQRIGKPEEAAAAIVWLASPSASYVIGHSMIVDGGLTAPYR
jgi:NAD(P)-dependent dehydrogenase (short-subunit alcohol dehydrogenase family)